MPGRSGIVASELDFRPVAVDDGDGAALDTGARQPHAQGLFESEGYVPIANFNGNPVATFFGQKRLSG